MVSWRTILLTLTLVLVLLALHRAKCAKKAGVPPRMALRRPCESLESLRREIDIRSAKDKCSRIPSLRRRCDG